MMPKSILGVEMVKNRDPNFQYVVQRSYLFRVYINSIYDIMSSTTLCVGTEHQFVELISV